MNHQALATSHQRFQGHMDPTAPASDPLAALKRGEPDALAAAYRAFAPALLRSLTGLLGERGEAEDVVHDLFVGLPEALARYEERGAPAAWIHRVAMRLGLSRLRTRTRRSEVDLDHSDTVGRRAAGEALPDQLLIRDALAALPEGLRTVVVLRELDGWSHGEIADFMGLTTGAVTTRHCRAMQRLRQALEGQR